MFRSLLAVCLSFAVAAQDPPAPTPAPAPAAAKVEVPTFPNPTCPIMGKKVSMPLFIDTELGRFYVCCKPCFKKVLADLPAAHKTAYPVVQDVKNTVCPVSGEPVGEHAVPITLQGFRFSLCCAGCVDAARRNSQVTLVKLTRPTAEDVGNDTCPVTDKPVAANAFVVVDGAIVHLAAPSAADAVAKDPAALLAKARALAKAQPPKAKHVHQPAGDTKPAEAGK